LGRARGLGPRGRRFKSCHPDLLDMFYCYVLESKKTGRRYVGSCEDLAARVERYNSGRVAATKDGIPWVLLHYEGASTRGETLKRERYYKTGRGRDELDRLCGP